MDKLKQKVAKEYAVEQKYVTLYGNARSSMMVAFDELNLPKNAKVATTAYTCRAAINPILWNSLEPLFVDIPDNMKSLNMCPKKLTESLENHEVAAIVIQPTFGSFVGISELVKIAKNNNIPILLDLAHCYGVHKDYFKDADYLILSFGLQKMLPQSRVGGALISRKVITPSLKKMPLKDQFLWRFDRYFWGISNRFGTQKRTVQRLFKRLNLINDGFFESEVYGKQPKRYPYAITDAIANRIALKLNTLPKIIEKRTKFTQTAHENINSALVSASDSCIVHYPVYFSTEKEKDAFKAQLTKAHIRPGKLYDSVLFPAGYDMELFNYTSSSCPNAEKLAAGLVSIDTYQDGADLNLIKR